VKTGSLGNFVEKRYSNPMLFYKRLWKDCQSKRQIKRVLLELPVVTAGTKRCPIKVPNGA
jgi:hypothetical protein